MARKISNRDQKRAAEFIVDEHRRRKENRKLKEKQWAEIDRQIRMEAKPLESKTGETVWFPQIELPLQANAREILNDDIARLIFPGDQDWYKAEAYVTEEWGEAFRNDATVGNVLGGVADQDTANIIVHGALDHFHRQYDYRGAWKKLIDENVSYGTFVGRWALVKTLFVSHDFRSTSGRKQPVLVPCSVKNTYLDDTLSFQLQENVGVSPGFIRSTWRRIADLKTQSGWDNVDKLQPSTKEFPGHVEVLEFEGDLILDRTKTEDMTFMNVRVTVAVQQTPMVLKWEKLDLPFRSYITGYYESDGTDSPYGTCPLMKGRPLQEAASLATNTSLAIATLQALPTIVYDADDQHLTAKGGPRISPNQKIAAENPDAIRDLQVGDLAAQFAMLQGLLEQYEHTTKVNDPRRGAQGRSHTTATASVNELSRGLLPTEDVVQGMENGAIVTSLYMEYELARRALKDRMPVYIEARGARGHLELSSAVLPESSDFTVMGSRGVFSRREMEQSFAEFTGLVANLTPLLVQAPPEAAEPLVAMLTELGRIKGITDVERYIPRPGTSPGQGAEPEDGPGVPPALAALQG